ncbi:MAG: hypothetical protein ACI9FJ_001662, partial [Alteromonadaceae bacterium]
DQLQQVISQRVLPAYQQLSTHVDALLNEAPATINFGQFTGSGFFTISPYAFTPLEIKSI